MYNNIKKEIYDFYNNKKVDFESISEVNDLLVDNKKELFNNDVNELKCIVSMCNYMIDNNLFDEYYFNTFKELISEIDMTNIEDRNDFDKDVEIINDYLEKESKEKEYYDKLSEVYNDKIN